MAQSRILQLLLVLCSASLALGQGSDRLQNRAEAWGELKWRGVGPAAMGGRITDLAVDPTNASTYYVATATGGLLRTKNRGITLEPVFEEQGTSSIGAVAVAPSSPSTVWVGTGEGNARNSASWGDGVYRSDDGGTTWKHMGLRETRHIARIAIHPTDPAVVYVAALGRFWGPNPERGLYRTRDGGETWELVLGLDSDTGCVDVRLDPKSPDIVYAASYAVRRDAFDGNDPVRRHDRQSGLWKSQDGGTTWKRLHHGLPDGALGRCALEVWPKDPRVVFALIETEFTGERAPGQKEILGAPAYLGVLPGQGEGAVLGGIVDGGPAQRAGLEQGDRILALGKTPIRSFDALAEALGDYRSGDEESFRIKRGEETRRIAVRFGSRDGQGFSAYLGGQKENVQERQGPEGFQTGGVFRSDDRGETWRRINSLNPRPFYFSQIRVDPTNDRRLWVLGVQLHTSEDGGKTFENEGAPGIHVDHHALWVDPTDPRHLLLGNDGGLHTSWDGGKSWEHHPLVALAQYYAVAVDNRQPYRIFGGLQDNGTWVIPSRTRQRRLGNEHAFKIGGGDGFLCAVDPRDDDLIYSESQNGAISRQNLRTGSRQRILPPGGMDRFNWRTPFTLSPHNAETFLFGGSRVYRSRRGGAGARAISEVLSLTKEGTLTAVAESPRRAGVLWAGTDDGALWVSEDDGKSWTAVHQNLPMPGPRWVNCIEPSRGRAGSAYVVCDGHRSDDLEPWVFATRNYGKSWRRLGADELPKAAARVIREDPKRRDVLYLGTETGAWASIDRGRNWFRLGQGLPTVPVHDLVVHPRENELIAGTHGRGAWILDVGPLQDSALRMRRFDLLKVKDVVAWDRRPDTGRYGHRRFVASNPSTEVVAWIWSGSEKEQKVAVSFEDLAGEVLHETSLKAKSGLNRAAWSLRRRGQGRRPGPRIPPGTYRVRARLGEEERIQVFRLSEDPDKLSELGEERP